MIEIEQRILKSIKSQKSVFINSSAESSDMELLIFLVSNLPAKNKILIITHEKITENIFSRFVQIETIKKSFKLLFNSSFENVIIYNISPFCEINGFWIEIAVQIMKDKTRFVYINPHTCFLEYSKYITNSEIINEKSSLTYKVFGYEKSKNYFLFEYKLNYKLNMFIKNKTIIFVSTQKASEVTADHILKDTAIRKNQTLHSISFDDAKLSELTKLGIGFHHRGLSDNDKSKVKDLYEDDKIQILITTSHSLNLKCDTLIIKSTKEYNQNGYCEYKIIDIIKMIRSCSKNGTVFILTEKSNRNYYYDVLIKKKGVSICDIKTENGSMPKNNKYQYSVIERNIPELFLTFLNYEKKVKEKMEIIFTDSFFYFKLGLLSKQFPIKDLINEVLEELVKNGFAEKTHDNKYEVFKKLADIFFSSQLSYESFISICKIKGDEEEIFKKLSDLDEIKYSKVIKTEKGKRKMNIIKNIMQNQEKTDQATNKIISELFRSCIKIKEAIVYDLSSMLIAYSKFASKDKHFFYLKNIEKNGNSYSNNTAKITFKSFGLEISINDNLFYYLVIEENQEIIISIGFKKQIFIDDIETKTYIVYLICIKEFHRSIILKYDSLNVEAHPKYYRKTRLNKSSPGIEVVKNVVSLGDIKMELFTPKKLTFPQWFTN